MSLALTPETQVHTIWFVGWSGGDFMAYVFRPADCPWIAEYRFRYHTAPVTGDPFNEKDEKSFYTYQNQDPDEGPENLVIAMKTISMLTAKRFSANIFDTLEINGNGVDAIRELQKKSWCFVRKVSLEEISGSADGIATTSGERN